MFQALIDELADFLSLGGLLMVPLIGLNILLWFGIGWRLMALRRGSVRSVRRLIRKLSKRPPAGNPRGLLDRAVMRGLLLAGHQPSDLRRRLDDAFADLEAATKRYRNLINTVVMVAPLLGLLGTVVGMIETFDSLGDMSLFAQSGGIAGGISQALVTTQLGLAVAIPGLIIGRMLDRRAAQLRIELVQIKDLLCASNLPEDIR